MNRPIAKPVGLSDEALFNARATKVTFVNPKGYEQYARVNGHNPGCFDWERDERRKRHGMEKDSLSVKGRPVE
jgi:hypothetical protein